MTRRFAIPVILFSVLLAAGLGSAGPRFYPDDPIAREPETEDASGAEPQDIGLLYDLTFNLFVTPRRTPSGTRAGNVNTVDEVPDSSWFTNRIDRGLPHETLVNGPIKGAAPDPSRWTFLREKASGYAPGFTAGDATGETWFLSFDPPSNPEGATAAVVIANRLFWALGYNQVEYFLTTVDPGKVEIAPDATARRPSRERTPVTHADLEDVLRRSARSADRTYRAVAGRMLKGTVLGGFHYDGTRPDDPNDLVPHEHRRELRALRVFGAWTNLTDLKAGNTLDAIEPSPSGHKIIRHYLQDVGSTFGMGANGPHDWDEGWEYFYQGDTTLRRLLSFGFWLSPWQKLSYPSHSSVGRFEGDEFDPATWKPHTATRAYIELRPDDAFWAAQKVAAFSDQLIRDIVNAGELSDPAAAAYLAEVLIKRRDKIARAYLPAVNPLVKPALSADGTLAFANAAVDAGVAEAATSYRAEWYRFDNATGESRRLGESTAAEPSLKAPGGALAGAGEFVRVDVSLESASHPSWREPVRLYFRRSAEEWKLVGLERLPEIWPAAPAITADARLRATTTPASTAR
jgi:hypothetical protein